MLFILGVGIVIALSFLPRLRGPGGVNTTELGLMSQRWLAEHRASHAP